MLPVRDARRATRPGSTWTCRRRAPPPPSLRLRGTSGRVRRGSPRRRWFGVALRATRATRCRDGSSARREGAGLVGMRAHAQARLVLALRRRTSSRGDRDRRPRSRDRARRKRPDRASRSRPRARGRPAQPSNGAASPGRVCRRPSHARASAARLRRRPGPRCPRARTRARVVRSVPAVADREERPARPSPMQALRPRARARLRVRAAGSSCRPRSGPQARAGRSVRP